MNYDFFKDLEFSMNENEQMDCLLIRQAIPHCIDVQKTDKETDKRGIDYIATLDGGAKINIDAKRRKPGKVRFVGDYPECALEIWSVMPDRLNKGKPGWACARDTDVDLILYAYDKSDWGKFYIVPFQLLRAAFKRHYTEWYRAYRVTKQPNTGRTTNYTSQCMFVPVNVLIQAVSDEMTQNIL